MRNFQTLTFNNSVRFVVIGFKRSRMVLKSNYLSYAILCAYTFMTSMIWHHYVYQQDKRAKQERLIIHQVRNSVLLQETRFFW